MPLVPIATGVERHGPKGQRITERRLPHPDKTRLAIRRRKTPVREGRAPPLEGFHLLIGMVPDHRMASQVEETCTFILIGRQSCVLTPDVGRPIEGESVVPAHAPADLLDDPPIRSRLPSGG